MKNFKVLISKLAKKPNFWLRHFWNKNRRNQTLDKLIFKKAKTNVQNLNGKFLKEGKFHYNDKIRPLIPLKNEKPLMGL